MLPPDDEARSRTVRPPRLPMPPLLMPTLLMLAADSASVAPRTCLSWLILLTTYVLGTSLALSVLAPNFQSGSGADSVHPAGRDTAWHNLDISASGPALLPFWALFGYFDPGELAGSHGSAFIAPLVL